MPEIEKNSAVLYLWLLLNIITNTDRLEQSFPTSLPIYVDIGVQIISNWLPFSPHAISQTTRPFLVTANKSDFGFAKCVLAIPVFCVKIFML